jgi:hypothetical protein
MSTKIIALLLALLANGSLAGAQTRQPSHLGAAVTWTAGGAAAGFGVGLWVGLHAFDDAINSDRKIWTTAAVGAAVGAVSGYFVGRARRSKTQTPTARLGESACAKPEGTLRHLTFKSERLGFTASDSGPTARCSWVWP